MGWEKNTETVKYLEAEAIMQIEEISIFMFSLKERKKKKIIYSFILQAFKKRSCLS